MSLVEHLLATRTPLELAKLAAQLAKENAMLKDFCKSCEVEIFWLKVKERDDKP